MDPAAYQNTAVFQIGMNKIPPNFDTLLATSLEIFWLFKGLNVWRLSKLSGVEGLNSLFLQSRILV